MSALTRRLAALLVALVACVLPAGSAQAAQTDNVAEAINQQDNTQVFDFAWNVSRQRGDAIVDHLNSATAKATLHPLRGDRDRVPDRARVRIPRQVVPINQAEAVNLECTECTVAAEARQWVRVFPDPVKFTGDGRAVLSDVRRDLAALETQNLPLDQLHMAVEAQEARVDEVLRDELVLKSDPGSEPDLLQKRSLQAADLG